MMWKYNIITILSCYREGWDEMIYVILYLGVVNVVWEKYRGMEQG